MYYQRLIVIPVFNGDQTETGLKMMSVNPRKDGAGDGVRTRDVQLGNPDVYQI
jgi:hypothetical protein